MKIVTWNIQWGRGVDGRVDLDRIVAHARALADFDVLCLQEVSDGFDDLPGNDGGNQFAALAQRVPGFTAIEGVAVDSPRAGGGRRRFGNMILSRLPVIGVYRHLLPWPAEPGCASMQRLALEANLDTPLGPLRVTTTHLEYYSKRQREAQVERLRALHREATDQARHGGNGDIGPFERLPRGTRAVITGDCNFRPDAPERQRLMADFDDDTQPYRDAWELAHPGRPHAPTVGLYDKEQWPGEPFTFDFFFVSADLAPHVRHVSVADTTNASDHQPMLLALGQELD